MDFNIIKIDQANYQHLKEGLALIVLKKMDFIEANKTLTEVKSSLDNAFSKNKRAGAFAAQDKSRNTIGFIFYNICSGLEAGGDYLWINEIYVTPTYRNNGIGQALLSKIESYAFENEFKCLLAVTGEENINSKTLFEKSNFSLSNTVWISKNL